MATIKIKDLRTNDIFCFLPDTDKSYRVLADPIKHRNSNKTMVLRFVDSFSEYQSVFPSEQEVLRKAKGGSRK